jgi:RNA polymerase sigma factor (sigma-70 family)
MQGAEGQTAEVSAILVPQMVIGGPVARERARYNWRKVAAFLREERERLVAYVRQRIDDAAERDGEDIVQDVALSVFNAAELAQPIENLSAYVYQALRNRVVDRMRRRREQNSLDAPLPGDTGLVLADILTDLKFDAAGDLERKEIAGDIEAAVESLDDKYRDIFLATELHGLSFQELSEEWDIPIGTLLARKSRAMKMLRDALVEIDPDHYSLLA